MRSDADWLDCYGPIDKQIAARIRQAADALLSAEAQITALKAERDEARPWMLFYRDRKTLGEVAAECGGSIYNYSPWLTAPMTRGALKDAERIIAAEAELKACNRHLSDALAARDEFHAAKRAAEAETASLSALLDQAREVVEEAVGFYDGLTHVPGEAALLDRLSSFLTRLSKTGGEEKQELIPSRTSQSSPDSRRPEALSDLEGER